ncbi:MAG TPA: GTPase Era [Solirubrobacterales bacterium]|nr:GTPase Era [Solirubrobacterales bacterium]
MTRSGIVGLAGRPNVGKSTLINSIVGAKVAIVSDRPQTTRRAARGVATDSAGRWQIVLVDLPGVQRPRDELTGRMQRRVERELAGADAALFVLDGEQGVGPGDRFIAQALLGARADVPVVCAVNKSDRLSPGQTARALAQTEEVGVADEIFPVSARTGSGVEAMTERLAELLPEGPLLYPAGERRDASPERHVAELIREQVLKRTRDEIPHAVEVMVDEMTPRDDGLVEVRAQIWAETESQKGILIGGGGRMVREIGTAARRELERELDARVFLDLRVTVRRHWRRDEALLDRLGIE